MFYSTLLTVGTFNILPFDYWISLFLCIMYIIYDDNSPQLIPLYIFYLYFNSLCYINYLTSLWTWKLYFYCCNSFSCRWRFILAINWLGITVSNLEEQLAGLKGIFGLAPVSTSLSSETPRSTTPDIAPDLGLILRKEQNRNKFNSEIFE